MTDRWFNPSSTPTVTSVAKPKPCVLTGAHRTRLALEDRVLLTTHHRETVGFLRILVLRMTNTIDLTAAHHTWHGKLLDVPGRLIVRATVAFGI